ncbi:carbamoyl phosphate phosphatase [Cronobacter condimenti 1330]|uniref:Carbamoyltransferase HypF n=1 Tax=Cronobacter condimenti 1330 TaxID=1073999 RepID=A0ABM5VBN0_9ENTR|nr:carbamoyltransferase HypF [Cronobacter condimenti]ALB62579.1 carbamoyl phosphate phosphatase [Cronobacter condimenti 1330]
MNHNGTILRIQGRVQGVGFRPYVWQLAQQLTLTGDVCNDGAGVEVRLTRGEGAFIAALFQHCPPLARIDSVLAAPFRWEAVPQAFSIRESGGGAMRTQITPDAATCPQCLRELNDPTDSRWRYPFINCTHCGPRFTIIQAMPYDRPNTAMAAFTLCSGCATQYRDPADRRFHAQPVACPTCGPQLSWLEGEKTAGKEAALQGAITALKNGQIVAIKGLGGFHLACDAQNAHAVARLRARKRRPAKPLAVMLESDAGLADDARARLNTPAAPIVLVDNATLPPLCDAIAPGLTETGVMLPANPLQHLLMQGVGRPLVMTSGNRSGEPPALTNAQALTQLSEIADGFLLHNRDILQRMDDSVMRPNGEMLRRARGFVPDALPLPPGFSAVPATLCLGADLKNTFCLARGDEAVLSQHLGDLSDTQTQAQWRQALALFREIYDFHPEHIVVDAHPGYRSTALGEAMGLPVLRVRHHHAHIAACLAEHRWARDAGPVIALALDGIGMGEAGQLWGGECLLADYVRCERLGGLPAVALPGGDLAARQPWRNWLAQWLAFVPDWQTLPQAAGLLDIPWQPLARAIERGINAPRASSTGRLFDAVAAMLGVAPAAQSYEGEAACRLEALARRHGPVHHDVTLSLKGNAFDMPLFWQSLLAFDASVAARAWAFHDALACGLAALARRHARARGITTIACGGGVLHNALLRERLAFYLHDFRLLLPQSLPAGDGAIAFGQAAIAAAIYS